MTRRKTNEEFVEEVSLIREDIKLLTEYVNNKHKIDVKHLECGHITSMLPTKILSGQGCGKCKGKLISRSKSRDNKYYIDKLIENGIDYIQIIGNYAGTKNKVLVKNLKCGHEYEANAGNILNGSGCPVCRKFNKTTYDFAAEINGKYPGEYEVVGEYVNNRTPISIKHLSCGHIWEVVPKDLLRQRRCPKCNMSAGEYYISNYLNDSGYSFDMQYKISECRNVLPLPFDFAVNVNNEIRLIEFDGTQHFGNGKCWGDTSRFESIKINDNIKNKFCEENSIKLLRIPYWWLRTDRIRKELDLFLGK